MAPALADGTPPPHSHPHIIILSLQPVSRVLCVSAAALGSQAQGGLWGWGRWAGRGPLLLWRWPSGRDPCPLPTLIYFRCLYAVSANTSQGAAATLPSQPPAPLTASSCIFDKVIGIFLLTGFSLHFTCSFPRADSTGSGAVCLAWLPFPIAGAVAGLTDSYLFCPLTSQ